jgi:hypothetical protein
MYCDPYIKALERTLLSPTYKLESSLPQDYNIPAMQEFFRQRPKDVFQRTTQILSEIGQCIIIIGSSMALLSSIAKLEHFFLLSVLKLEIPYFWGIILRY